jgi:hypothetical protein
VGKSEVIWSRRFFDTLSDNGIWGVPRSGLIFRREGKALVLRAKMPFSEIEEAPVGADVPETEADLLAWQQKDFEAIAKRFRAAGIEVRDATGESQ